MDVAAWNAVHPDNPRDSRGRFTDGLGDIVASLAADYGELVAHEAFGDPDDVFSSPGVVSVHQDVVRTDGRAQPVGTMIVSRIDPGDEGALARTPVLSALTEDDAEGLEFDIERALEELAGNQFPAGTHREFPPEENSPYLVSFGVMSDGTQYVAIGDNSESGDGEDIQMSRAGAEEFLGSLSDARERQFRYRWNPDSPYETQSLPAGQQLMKRKVISSQSSDDVILGLVEGPAGPSSRRLRLGLGGSDDYPAKNWTGGRGQTVADLGPDEAAKLDEVLGQTLARLSEYAANLRAAEDLLGEHGWEASPGGQRWKELMQEWTVYRGAVDEHSADGVHVVRASTYGRRQEGIQPEHAPADIEAEVRTLGDEQHQIWTDAGAVEEGDVFDQFEVGTPWGTVGIDLYGWTLDYSEPVSVRLTVRPPGVGDEEWGYGPSGDAYSELSESQIKNLRKLVRQAFSDAQGMPVVKAAGAAADTPGAGRAAALKRHWTRGKGRALWIRSAHPWTALRRHLARYIKNPNKLDRVTSQWFHDATGMWPGERKGKNPVGRG